MSMKKITDIRVEKNLIREKSKAYRLGLDTLHKAKINKKITNRFLNLWLFRETDLLLIYVSTDIEVDTHTIINRALEAGKTVAVPRCIEGTRDIDFYIIEDLKSLRLGTFDVPEPEPDKEKRLTDFEGALCVVPALAYDSQGYRIGFGKGYFDRFLTRNNLKTIGLTYDACLLDSIPKGKYDKKVDMIITESKILDFDS